MVARYRSKQFYAYVHARPNSRTARGIFHVGKGSEARMYNFSNSRNAEYKNVVSRLNESKVLIGVLECSTEEVAFELEKGLIKRLRVMGVGLTNETGGGIGALEPSASLREKLRPNWDDFGAKAADRNRNRVWKSESKAVIAAKTRENFKGLGFITDGTVEKRFPLKDTPSSGWRFGRLPVTTRASANISAGLIGNTHTLGKKFITDGVTNTMINAGQQPPNGWWFGMSRRS